MGEGMTVRVCTYPQLILFVFEKISARETYVLWQSAPRSFSGSSIVVRYFANYFIGVVRKLATLKIYIRLRRKVRVPLV